MGNWFNRFLKKKKEKQLKYVDNERVLCYKCEKPRYMGMTNKPDSELCTCAGQDKILVYDKRTETKELSLISKYYQYE